MDDCLKRQTSTATPAEPGGFPWGLKIRFWMSKHDARVCELAAPGLLGGEQWVWSTASLRCVAGVLATSVLFRGDLVTA